MKYDKPSLTFEQQADLLITRGLVADRDVLISRLQAVNYYRLSGYIYPFRESDTVIKKDTTLDVVWHHYTFDRQLRMIIMDAIERVEVAVRTQLVYHFTHSYNPFAYVDSTNMPGLDKKQHERWLEELTEETNRSTEPFIKHFRSRYGDCHPRLPLWMLVEVMSFGKTLTLFKGVHRDLARQIASQYHVPDEVLKSWLLSLNGVRNICAHHGRLWNRVLGLKPKLPSDRKYPEWGYPVDSNAKIFIILTILRFLLRNIANTSLWEERLRSLLKGNPDISITAMGFPNNWEENPLWK